MRHIGLSFPEVTPETVDEPETSAAPDLESLTVSQLRELAAMDGVELGSAKTKAEIISAISAAKE